MNIQRLLTEQYQTSHNLEARIQLHERFNVNKYDGMLWVFDQIDLPPSCQILEVGCGTGKLWKMNLHRLPAEWSITLSDFSAGMLAKAKENLAGADHDFAFEVFNVCDIPYGAQSFDAIIANFMLYHASDLSKALSEIQRVLKPGGKFYAATNGENHMRELKDVIPSYIPYKPASETIRRFLLQNGQEALSRYFGDVELRYYDNALVVTEAEPLAAYCLSRLSVFSDHTEIDEAKRTAFVEYVGSKLREHGGKIRITKETGMFIASQPRAAPAV